MKKIFTVGVIVALGYLVVMAFNSNFMNILLNNEDTPTDSLVYLYDEGIRVTDIEFDKDAYASDDVAEVTFYFDNLDVSLVKGVTFTRLGKIPRTDFQLEPLEDSITLELSVENMYSEHYGDYILSIKSVYIEHDIETISNDFPIEDHLKIVPVRKVLDLADEDGNVDVYVFEGDDDSTVVYEEGDLNEAFLIENVLSSAKKHYTEIDDDAVLDLEDIAYAIFARDVTEGETLTKSMFVFPKGSCEKPYKLFVQEDFSIIETHPKACYSLESDIHVIDTDFLYDNEIYLDGFFYGNGHTLLNAANATKPLFAGIKENSVVDGLVFEDYATVLDDLNYETYHKSFGLLSETNHGTIRNIQFKKSKIELYTKLDNVGMVVGINYGTIHDIRIDNSTIKGFRTTNVGGVSGKTTEGNIYKVGINNLSMYGLESAGGISGRLEYTTYKNSFNSYQITNLNVGGDYKAGLLFGELYFSSIELYNFTSDNDSAASITFPNFPPYDDNIGYIIDGNVLYD